MNQDIKTYPLSQTGGDWQIPIAVQLLYVLSPIQFLMVFASTTQVTAGLVVAAFIGLVGIVLFLSSHIGLHWDADRPVIYGLVFMAIAAFGIATTPYGAPAVSKGLVNWIAIITMLSMVLVIVRTVVNYDGLFQHLIRISAYVTGVTAALGIFQFFTSNVLTAPQFFDLSSLSSIAGHSWWTPAIENGITRAQSIYSEPSVLAGFLGFTVGVAFLRLGLFGKEKREALRGTVPLWAAWCIVLCMVLTFSPVCYTALFFTAVGIPVSGMKIRLKTAIIIILVSVVVLAVCVGIVLAVGGSMMQRFTSLVVFSQLAGGGGAGNNLGALNYSTVILFLNAAVTLHNVSGSPVFGVGMGAHPFSYDAYLGQLSAFGRIALQHGNVIATNKMDAAALFLRLMSETGVAGTLAFTAMCFSAMLRARRAILDRLSMGCVIGELDAISIGVNGAMLGLFVAFMFRIPQYYSTPFWTLFALCTAIPSLGKVASRVENALRPSSATS